MARSTTSGQTHRTLIQLSRLLLPSPGIMQPGSSARNRLQWELLNLRPDHFDVLVAAAQTHHVIVRGLESARELIRGAENLAVGEWIQKALTAERTRIARAIHFLHKICSVFQECGYDITVIKSLDHWPDLGSDLDLFTSVNAEDAIKLMSMRFDATIAPRSWGDRLAHKWNFLIPGLPESVEIHVGRLGQTGEQSTFASSLASRSVQALRGGYSFPIPCASDRLTISTLQRMYRHFYFRLCDVIDAASLCDAGAIDYDDLLASAQAAGIWEGVATYLVIVSDYVESYRNSGLALPRFVASSAKFGGREIYYGRGLLRVPIMPQSARLYGSQLAGVLGRGEINNGARLTLLPWLATAAALGQKLTGSDKGIW
jgi:hypothetical protein